MSLLSSATAMCLHVCGEREGGQECKGASHQETDTGPAEIISYFLNILPFHNKIYVSKSHISCLQSWKWNAWAVIPFFFFFLAEN